MSQYKVNINPFNHLTITGPIVKQPQFLQKPSSRYQVFKVIVLAPRNYINHDPKTGKPMRRGDLIKASCYVTDNQAHLYKRIYTPKTWVTLRGELRYVKYVNNNGQVIHARPFNLEDIQKYKVPHTDKVMMTNYDKQKLITGIKSINWMLGHPGFVRRFANPAYCWLMAHDAFVPTRIKPHNNHNQN